MTKYSNLSNIPLPLAVFLATDSYDKQDNTISATTLLKPIRQIVLEQRLPDTMVDVKDLVSSRMGSAIHTAIEQAWLNPSQALKALGYSDKVIDRIKINPTNPDKNDINVFMERRSSKEALGFTITGKFDFVSEGKVQDFKSTSVYTYLNQTNTEKYQLQGSIYRWLNPDIITQDTMTIHFIFTDWNKVQSLKDKDYPNNRVLSQNIPLFDLNQTEAFVHSRLKQIKQHLNTPEPQLPLCTDKDLWRKADVFKYYKDPNKLTRSTRNFDSLSEASAYMAEQNGQGIIKQVKGQVTACRYCPAFALCTQKDAYIASGELTL